MAEVTYNIGNDLINRDELFSKVFLNLPYPLARGKVSRERVIQPGQFATFTEAERPNQYYPVRFSYSGNTFVNGVRRLVNINFAPRLEPLWELTLRKNVVQTAVAGRDFTVKEIISAEDWQVRCRGFFIYDEDQDGDDIELWRLNTLQGLNDLVRANVSVKAECDLFVPFGFDRLVFTDLRLPVLEGYPNVIPYELQAVSDIPIELELTN